MKRSIILMLAVVSIIFSGCSKHNAKKFEGTYKVVSNVNYSNLSTKAGFSNTETGTITITATGGNSVVVTGLFNTTGTVDHGVLMLDAEEHVGAGIGADVTFLGYNLAGVSFTTNLQHGVATLNDDGTMTWTSSGAGHATVGVLGLEVTLNANAEYSNTAIRE